MAPTGWLNVKIDGGIRRTSSGLGRDCIHRSGVAGRCTDAYSTCTNCVTDSRRRFCVRIDPFAEALAELEDRSFASRSAARKKVTIVVSWSEATCKGSPSKKVSCAC